ncbi:fimbria/pilus outer membrane usher protein [Izhakiella australiensis]|nr:fimbria/pilus outer membrane usher protein [Izhakiella australiensis]
MNFPDVGDMSNDAKRRANVLPFTFTLIGGLLFYRSGWAATEPPSLLSENENETIVNFNPRFLHGRGIDVSRFSEGNPILPGKQKVTVLVNGERRGKMTVLFSLRPGKKSAEACFSLRQLRQIGIRIADKPAEKTDSCRVISEWVSWGKSRYDSGEFELNLQVPQLYVKKMPRGYVDPGLWDAGETVGFLDYSGNVFSIYNGGNSAMRGNTYTGNLGMMAGININQWRLRKRINASWNSRGSSSTQNLNGYAAHDITALKSELILGENNTSGDIFDSYGLRGVFLQSDDRMLPDSLRSYSPVLRGVAETNARVTVRQRGMTIYETVVPPGPFELSNIGTMGYGGDLEMVVTESDGRVRRTNIPYSAPPLLLHEGVSYFAFSAGQLKEELVRNHPAVVQGSYRYGLSDRLTLFGGMQIGEKYQSIAAGSALNTPLGGVSFGISHARSTLNDDQLYTGNSYQLNFTKYLGSTDTNLLLGAYRYSSSGYYSFRDASIARNNRSTDGQYIIDFRQRDRLSVTLSQQLSDNMSLYLTGNQYNYWGNRSSSRQYSVTFNQRLRHFSYGVTASRTLNDQYKSEKSVLLFVNIPIGNGVINRKPVFNSLYTSLNHDSGGNTQLQTLVNGSQGEQNEWNYGLGGTLNHYPESRANNSVTGNLSYQAGFGRLAATASADNHSTRQLSFSADGSLVAHKGGITLGPAVGDAPFAIVDAREANGAKLLNGYGSRIDRNGYAIMPSLTPYRENTISVSAKGLPLNVDLMENEKVVVPRAGAVIPVEVQTISGNPMILTLRDEKGQLLPIGTDLQNAKGISQGIIGQGGQAFIRGWQPETQSLFAVVNGQKMQCRARTSPDKRRASATRQTQILQLEVICLRN